MASKIVDSLRPVPVPDELTRPYWEAAKQRRLAIQRCQGCKTYYHPPVHQCFECESRDLKYEPVNGKGTIYTYTRLHGSPVQAFAEATPFAVVQVELAEQPGLLISCNMADTDPEQIKMDAPVEVTFIKASDGMALPDFTLSSGAG